MGVCPKKALKIRMKSALITLREVARDHGSLQKIKYGTGGYMTAASAIEKTLAAAKKERFKLK